MTELWILFLCGSVIIREQNLSAKKLNIHICMGLKRRKCVLKVGDIYF
jgi:hypothetical protein